MKPHTQSRETSFWERRHFFSRFDLLIVGSGLVGLSAALHARRLRPEARIALVEGGVIPSGATTRNAGFGCFGSPTELADDLQHMTAAEVWDLVASRWRGLALLREEIGDRELGLESWGGYEVFLQQEKTVFADMRERLPYFNQQFRRITGQDVAMEVVEPSWAQAEMAGLGGVIRLKLECQLDPGRMTRALIRKTQARDIPCFNGLRVAEILPRGDHWQLITRPAVPLEADRVLVATNGFARSLLPGLALQAARNQVIITEPLGPAFSWKGCFHYRSGYVYFRNVEDRVLLGGFRHLDPQGETTDQFGSSPAIQTALEEWLHTVLFPDRQVAIAQRWSGILGVGAAKRPILKMVQPGLGVAVRLGGMGIALGNELGRKAAEMLLENPPDPQ